MKLTIVYVRHKKAVESILIAESSDAVVSFLGLLCLSLYKYEGVVFADLRKSKYEGLIGVPVKVLTDTRVASADVVLEMVHQKDVSSYAVKQWCQTSEFSWHQHI